MRYVQPFGTPEDSPYVNGDPTIGRQGSIPPAQAIEHPQREIVNVINFSGIAPSADDLRQMTRAVRSQALNYARDTGSVNQLSVAYDPPITVYTLGLVLRVRVNHPNTGACSINAGAGNRPIRKMNGADLAEGDLVAGSLATMVFDGTNFQLSNFGGGLGGKGDVFTVKIPYTVDHSPTPNEVRANFLPPLELLSAGDMLAVKIANTNTGPTQMWVDNQAPVPLQPNGGGIMLQGDVAEGDVVIFFFDGTQLFFAPNPEINASIEYTVAPPGSAVGYFQDTPGQSGTAFNNAMNAIRRKTIGANGRVIFQLAGNGAEYPGPLRISHPSADRITVKGTMRPGQSHPHPVTEFVVTGNTPAARAVDAISNRWMLASKYGTIIKVPNTYVWGGALPGDTGLAQDGPGAVTFADLLVVGDDLPMPPAGWTQTGVICGMGCRMACLNVSVWGCQSGFDAYGSMWLTNCFVVGSGHASFSTTSTIYANNCHTYGSGSFAFYAEFGAINAWYSSARGGASTGFSSSNGAGMMCYWCNSLGNAVADLSASFGASLVWLNFPAQGLGLFNTSSPTPNVVGNIGAVAAVYEMSNAGHTPRPW